MRYQSLTKNIKFSNLHITLTIFTLLLVLSSCSEKTVDYTPPTAMEYYPMQVGSTFTYKLDSTVTTQFGADTTVHSYRVKDSVAEQFTDNLGRIAYRIQRSIQPYIGATSFKNSETFVVALQDDDWVEYVENNLRFMKLRSPLEQGFSWKAHSFIETTTINSSVRYLEGWEYNYQDVDVDYNVLGKTYNNCAVILQRDEQFPEGAFNPSFYKQWNYGLEVYAKGIGLIYKNFDHKTWQPPTPNGGTGRYEDGSYRIVLQLESFKL